MYRQLSGPQSCSPMPKTRMLILLDQDGVLADFELAFHKAWSLSGQSNPPLSLENRRSFYVRDDYPAECRGAIEAIYTSPGFYRNLPPIPGAVDAVMELLAAGHDVRIYTSPLTAYRNCVSEKYEWVEQHFGLDFVARLIVTKDKTIVHGDILVDDKPDVTGTRSPDWRHVVFDQPYNRMSRAPRINWTDWRSVLLTSPVQG